MSLPYTPSTQVRSPPHILETMSMKALILNAMKHKTEATELIKQALFKNLNNFMCWHIYGLLHRSNKNYDEARKAYLNALKFDSKN